jgi:hypothetical protein
LITKLPPFQSLLTKRKKLSELYFFALVLSFFFPYV